MLDFGRYSQNDDSNLVIKCLNKMKYYKYWESYKKILTSRNKPKGHYPCVCNSGRKLRDCHKKVFNGLWNLHEHIKIHPTILK